MSRPLVVPPDLYNALKAEGFLLPDECADLTMTMPVDGIFQLNYVVNLRSEDLIKIGCALERLGLLAAEAERQRQERLKYEQDRRTEAGEMPK